MLRISRDYPDLTPLPQSYFEPATDERPLRLAFMLGIANYVNDPSILYATLPRHDENRTIYLSDKTGWTSLEIFQTNDRAKRTLLLIRDSFATELIPLLKPHFKQIIVAHHKDGIFR